MMADRPVTHEQQPDSGWGRELGTYVLFVLLSVLILGVGLKLHKTDLSIPFEYDEDTLLIMPLVKQTVEGGTHWRNPRMGAPGVQETYDFPIIDHLHFLIIRLMAIGIHDPGLVFNLFYLGTYPLTVITMLLVLRHFQLSRMAAGVGAMLYAFLPYHYLRGEHHYFLAAYYVTPLSGLLALWLCNGRLPFFRPVSEGVREGQYRLALWNRDTLVAVLIAAATASAGAYGAFFACAVFVVAGLYGWMQTCSVRAMISAFLVIGAVVLVGTAHHAPTFWYQAKFGNNSSTYTRHPFEAEWHGMKLTHLLLPVTKHQSQTLADVRATYTGVGRPMEDENQGATLGIVGSVGFLGLLIALIYPRRTGWPYGPLAALTIFLMLLGTIGGFGSLFSFLVSPQVRAYNRVSIIIAFFTLFAALWAIDRRIANWPACLRVGVLTALAVFGLWDQLARPWFRQNAADARRAVATRYQRDAAFFAQIEATMPHGMVFMLPYVKYPEDYATPLPGGYVHSRAYWHTRTMRWSFGAMKGREIDLLHRRIVSLPPAAMLQALVVNHFDGLFIDTHGYPHPKDVELLTELQKTLGNVTPLRHPDGLQIFIDIRDYKARLEAEQPAQLATLRKAEAERLHELWLHGFVSYEKVGHESNHRWCGRHGQLILVNPTNRPRQYRCTMVFGTAWLESADLKIEGGEVWSDRFPINKYPVPKEYLLTVPPGRHTIHFTCQPPAEYRPNDTREQIFFLAQFVATPQE